MINTGVTTALKMLLLEQIKGDTFKLALYAGKADIGPDTESYTAIGEITGLGYKAGGIALQNCRVHEMDGDACISWDSPTWPNATITASGFMIYDASRKNAAVFVGSWGAEYTSTNGPFRVNLADGQVIFS